MDQTQDDGVAVVTLTNFWVASKSNFVTRGVVTRNGQVEFVAEHDDQRKVRASLKRAGYKSDGPVLRGEA